MTALIQGTFIGIGFALVRLPSPVVFGVLGAAAAFIPAVGTGVVMIPAILYLAFSGRWGAAVFFALWSAGVIAAEYLLRPVSPHGMRPSLRLRCSWAHSAALPRSGWWGFCSGRCC